MILRIAERNEVADLVSVSKAAFDSDVHIGAPENDRPPY